MLGAFGAMRRQPAPPPMPSAALFASPWHGTLMGGREGERDGTVRHVSAKEKGERAGTEVDLKLAREQVSTPP